jgi:hypothetical protein
MMKRIVIAVAVAAVFLTGAYRLSAAGIDETQTLKGYVTDTYCGFNRVSRPPRKECTLSCVRDQHAKYAFFNFADKKVYILNPQSEAAKYAGQTVEVTGTVGGSEQFTTMKGQDSGAIITASSITPESTK